MQRTNPWWLVLVAVGAGCIAEPSPDVTGLVGFLLDGRTTPGEVKQRLGEPSGIFESGHLLTYRVGYDGMKQHYAVIPREGNASGWPDWIKANYSLVLRFEGGVLRQHELIKVK
jgi:hypothetical protein